jgi:hypothetical protein
MMEPMDGAAPRELHLEAVAVFNAALAAVNEERWADFLALCDAESLEALRVELLRDFERDGTLPSGITSLDDARACSTATLLAASLPEQTPRGLVRKLVKAQLATRGPRMTTAEFEEYFGATFPSLSLESDVLDTEWRESDVVEVIHSILLPSMAADTTGDAGDDAHTDVAAEYRSADVRARDPDAKPGPGFWAAWTPRTGVRRQGDGTWRLIATQEFLGGCGFCVDVRFADDEPDSQPGDGPADTPHGLS